MKKYILLVLVLVLLGCKTQHSIKENIATDIDSTSISNLRSELESVLIKNSDLKRSLEKERSENSLLSNVIENHLIEYDTQGEVNEETGKYPIAKEEISINTSTLKKEIQEKETLLEEYKTKIQSILSINQELRYDVSMLKNENKELINKISNDSFSLKWFSYGLLSMLIIGFAVFFILKLKF